RVFVEDDGKRHSSHACSRSKRITHRYHLRDGYLHGRGGNRMGVGDLIKMARKNSTTETNRVRTMEKQDYENLYYQMVLIRRVEEESAQLYQQGKIGGFLHLYIGQEAVSTGLIAARKPQDRVITAYRDHGVAINVGIPAKEVMAELLGKATGVSKGKGGSMHMADVKKNFWGGHAVVGAHLPIAAGLALGDVYQGNDGVTICMFGDGATNIGFFHEALNLSKVWNLPVMWVCENNKYGMGTSVDRASAVSE